MLYRYAACLLALVPALISWGVLPARADSVEFAIYGTSPLIFPVNGMGGLVFEANLAPQSTLIRLPTLSEAGGTGRLDKVTIWSNAFGNLEVVHDLGVETLDEVDGIWLARGSYNVSGRMRLISEGTTVATKQFSRSFYTGCGGSVIAPCTITDFYYLFETSSIAVLSGPEIPLTMDLVLDELRVFVNLNDDRGTFSGGPVSGHWWTDVAILEVAYDYTPVSQVPLPGAAGLLLSAVACLGLVQVRKRRAAMA